MSEFIGQVYIVCLEKPLQGSTARHYVGFATHLEKRIQHHRNGTGAALLRAANQQGISWKVTRVFKNASRKIERQIKNTKNATRFCPECYSKANRKLSTPKGYIEPVKQFKRAYLIKRNGLNTVIERITVPQVELLKKLVKRFKIGESFRIENKLYLRRSARKSSPFLITDIES